MRSPSFLPDPDRSLCSDERLSRRAWLKRRAAAPRVAIAELATEFDRLYAEAVAGGCSPREAEWRSTVRFERRTGFRTSFALPLRERRPWSTSP